MLDPCAVRIPPVAKPWHYDRGETGVQNLSHDHARPARPVCIFNGVEFQYDSTKTGLDDIVLIFGPLDIHLYDRSPLYRLFVAHGGHRYTATLPAQLYDAIRSPESLR